MTPNERLARAIAAHPNREEAAIVQNIFALLVRHGRGGLIGKPGADDMHGMLEWLSDQLETSA